MRAGCVDDLGLRCASCLLVLAMGQSVSTTSRCLSPSVVASASSLPRNRSSLVVEPSCVRFQPLQPLLDGRDQQYVPR